MQYAVRRNLLGSYSVKYGCPKCKTRLTSALKDAGTPNHCPDCGEQFTVPGTKEKQQAEKLKEQAAVERQREREHAIEEKKQEELLRNTRNKLRPRQLTSQPVTCPYCGLQIPRGVQKCGHCGEWLVGTGHSDWVALALGCLFGPVGLWYKGHWVAGFAWLAFIMITMVATGGLGLLLSPLFWIGMTIHAFVAPGRRR